MTEQSVQQAYNLAVERYRSGRWAEAEAFCRQVVGVAPCHVEAGRLLGILALQGGRHAEAQELLRRAIGLAPGRPQLHNDLGSALMAGGKLHEAIGAFRRARELDAQSIDAACNLGMALMETRAFAEAADVFAGAVGLGPGDAQMHLFLGDALREAGRNEEAVAAYQTAVNLGSRNADTHLRLGRALKAAGRVEEALGAYLRSGELSPELAEAHFNAGNALRELKRLPEATQAYVRALQAKPGYADAMHNLATVFEAEKRWDEAIAAFGEAIRLRPGFGPGYWGLGKALLAHRQLEEAVAVLRQAVAIDPGSWESVLSLGDALLKVGADEEALEQYRRAREIAPGEPSILVNWGGLLERKRDSEGAIKMYRQALAMRPDFAEAKYNLSLSLLRMGQFEEGWNAYEARWHVLHRAYDRGELPQPVWSGEDLRGKRLLVHLEQGFGDAIQFVRYVPLLIELGARVIMRCDVSLRRLFEQSMRFERVLGEDEPLPDFDYQVALLSVPRVMGTTLETIPAVVPYLTPSEELVAKWRDRLSSETGAFRIGMAWAGNPKHDQDRTRSMPLRALVPLGSIPNARFYSLQKGEARKQILDSELQVTDLADELNDFADTAAVMMNLDLVLSVDTAVAHLGGALGRRTWVMLRHEAEWRWMEGRTDSAWYPTMRVFQQRRVGDWADVVGEVSAALR